MKAILMPIRPEWCNLIASGKKTVEIRKTQPRMEMPFKVYIYCTSPNTKDPNRLLEVHNYEDQKIYKCNGKVIGEFVCDKIESFGVPYPAFQSKMRQDILKNSCMSYQQLHEYGRHDALYAWHISGLKIYDKPKELIEFNKPNVPDINDVDELCDGCRATCGENLRCTEDLCLEAYRSYIQAYFMIKRPPQSWCYVEELED